MSIASISYGSLRDAASEARDVAKKLDKYADSINSSVYKKLNNYEGTWTGNITTARSKASTKISDLRYQADKYRDYANELNELKSECESVDKAVRSKVSSLTASFKAAHGINNNVVVNTISYFFTSIGNSTKPGRWLNEKSDQIESGMDYLKEKIEDWYDYNGGKEFIKGIVIAALEIAIAVAGILAVVFGTITGVWAVVAAIAAVVGGIIAIADGVFNIINECEALGNASDDPATAKRLSDLDSMADTMRMKSDSKFWHGIAKALDTATFVCGVIGIVDGIGKLAKNVLKWGTGNLTSLDDLRMKDILTRDNIAKTFTKLKTTFSDGWKEIGVALQTSDWGFFGDILVDFKTDFLTNLKNSFDLEKLKNVNIKDMSSISSAAKTSKNYLKVIKGFVSDGFSISNILGDIVLPSIGLATVTSIEAPEGGGQMQFEFDQIKLDDITDLWKIKTDIFDDGQELINLDNKYFDPAVLEKMNTSVETDISIREIYVPRVNFVSIRAM